jgi:hypothetical protein
MKTTLTLILSPIIVTTLYYSFILSPEYKVQPKFHYHVQDIVLPSNTDSVLKDITLPAIVEKTNSVTTNKTITIIVTNNVEQGTTKETNSIPYHPENTLPVPNVEPYSSLPLSPASFPVAYTCPYWLYRNPAVGKPVSDTVGE